MLLVLVEDEALLMRARYKLSIIEGGSVLVSGGWGSLILTTQ